MSQPENIKINAQAPIDEQITMEQITISMGKKVSKYPDNQFYYRVYVHKTIGTMEDQKERALNLARDKIMKLQSHRIGNENGMSSSHRKCLVCPETGCPWKAVLLLVCRIQESPSKERDLSLTHSGWVIFTGTFGGHIGTVASNVTVISGFEEIVEVFENHHEQGFNLIAIPCKKEESAYDVQEVKSQRAEDLPLKYGLMQIWEVKQIVRMLQGEEQTQDPIKMMDLVVKFLADIQKNELKDEDATIKKYFSRAIKDVFHNMQIEGCHQQFSSRVEVDSEMPQLIVNCFSWETHVENKSYILKLKAFNDVLCDQYFNSSWKVFCKIAKMTSDKFVLPWIQPSLNFSCDSKVKLQRKLSKLNLEKLQSLKQSTYRNGRKETAQDQQIESVYQSIGNLMLLDVKKGKADFNTVPDILEAEKVNQIDEVEKAQKQVNELQEQFDDISKRLKQAKLNLSIQEECLSRNDFLSKQWLKLGPTVIAAALKSQEVKVEQVNGFMGEAVQLNRINDETNFQNQFGQAKTEYLTKFEETPLTQSTAAESQSIKSKTPKSKSQSKKKKKESKSKKISNRKKRYNKESLDALAKLNFPGVFKQMKTDQVDQSTTQDGEQITEQTQIQETPKVENEITPSIIERQTKIAEKQLSRYKNMESPRPKYDSVIHNAYNQELEI